MTKLEKIKQLESILINFRLSEFDSPDSPGSGYRMQPSTLLLLQKTRELADTPFVITSGYRTRSHNKRVGGVKGSSHTKGYAVDVRCRKSQDRYKILNAALQAGFNRIGISGQFIHLDNDPNKVQNVIWTY